MGEVRQVGCNFCKVANGDWAIDSQSIRLEEDAFFLEQCKKMASRASKFNAAKAAIAKDVAADANLSCVVAFDASGGNFEVFFEFRFRCRHRGRHKDDLVVVGWCSED